jgi:hypothetical protein
MKNITNYRKIASIMAVIAIFIFNMDSAFAIGNLVYNTNVSIYDSMFSID